MSVQNSISTEFYKGITMYKNIKEYGDFLVSIGKKYCYLDELANENERLSILQQEVLTGLLLQNDLTTIKNIGIPKDVLPSILKEFSEIMISDGYNEQFLKFIKEKALESYYKHCELYLSIIWKEKDQCETKS